MYRSSLLAIAAAIVLVLALVGDAFAAGAGPAVTVQIKTASKTLDKAVVHGGRGSLTKFGAPKGKCSRASAAGALDAATHGDWKGKYFAKFGDYLVTSILGVKPPGKDFWELVVNGKPASTGVCHVKLHPHERIVFKIAK